MSDVVSLTNVTKTFRQKTAVELRNCRDTRQMGPKKRKIDLC